MRRAFWVLTLGLGLAAAACNVSPAGDAGACGTSLSACLTSAECCAGFACLEGRCAFESGGPGGGPTGGIGSSGSTGGTTGNGSTTGTAGGPGTTGGSTGGFASGGSSGGGTTGSAACGALSEPCCGGAVCNGSLACVGGACVQPQATAAGQPCTKNSDCPSGICLPVGQPPGQSGWTGNVCTASCGAASDCVPGWSCGPLLGQSGDVCQCQYSPEVCNGKDDDCNGIVDDEPAVDQACESQNPTYVCRQGSCACPPQDLCGGACVDLQDDPANCGSCGDACAFGASCSNGQCACPAGESACGGQCVSLASVDDCGSCGNVCATGASCSGGQCACPHGQGVCGGQCIDLTTTANCG
ncbi:MAG TPA: hypothetical protein VMB50_08625, partial [Myxococcales bacterium]|nr:hypothetical protein [Myxococcales bacterium]